MIMLSACAKTELKPSDEVFIGITNECRCKISIFNCDTGRQFLHDIFDCNYISILAIKLPPGKYKLKAENFQGRIVCKSFTKSRYLKEIDIEF